jgi:hypothetical protein
MKNLTVILTALLCLSACAPTNINIQISSPFANETKTAGVGDVFFHYESMTGEDNHFGKACLGSNSMFELTVVQLTESNISLQYREFMKPISKAGCYSISEPWLVKQAFSQEFKYDLAQKVIKFKSYEFKVLEVSGGSIKYQRTM